MKIKQLLALTLLTTPLMANAGLFTSAVTSGWEDKATTHKYKLSTYGYDVRVYEWVPSDNPDVRCVFVAGETNSTGVACYEIKKEETYEK